MPWNRFNVNETCRLGLACTEPLQPTHDLNQVDEHPDKPERLSACIAGLTAHGLWPRLQIFTTRSALDEELYLVHPKAQIAGLKRAQMAALKGLVWLPPRGCLERVAKADLRGKRGRKNDTFVTTSSLDAARCAVGGLLQLVDESLQGSCLQGIALCRPPGHHAGPSSSTGFCLLNNVAVAARYAMHKYPTLVQRVLIFDWDIHHGQGTQEIFWKDSNVLVVSMHLFAKGFYPSSGSPQEVGVGEGCGYTINVALPEGYTDACLLRACQDVLVPAARRFKPDLILVSAGFDAIDGDPLGEAKCTADGFGRLARLVSGLAWKLCQGRLLLALEGGYDTTALADAVGAVAGTLLDVSEAKDDACKTFPELVEACKLNDQEPLAASLKAIWSTRSVHRLLPLRLMDGTSSALVPFSGKHRKRKREGSKNLNED